MKVCWKDSEVEFERVLLAACVGHVVWSEVPFRLDFYHFGHGYS